MNPASWNWGSDLCRKAQSSHHPFQRRSDRTRTLGEIHGLNRSLYADKVALWVAGGSDGHVKNTLQEAINSI